MSKHDKLNKYIENISNSKYHADKEYLSSSQVKKAIDSPANFRWLTMQKPEEKLKWEKGNAMDFGSLVHAMAMEPHVIDKEFAFLDTVGRNFKTKVDQQYRNNFLQYNANRIVLDREDIPRAETCVEVMMNHPFLKRLIDTEGKVEMSGFYKDDFYGRYLRFRPDKLIYNFDGTDTIVDVKTTRNIEGFVKDAKWNFHYDLSAYMYCDGHQKLTGNFPVFYFGVVESHPPHRVAVFKASDDFLMKGKEKYGKAMSNISIAMGIKPEHIQWQMADYQEI